MLSFSRTAARVVMAGALVAIHCACSAAQAQTAPARGAQEPADASRTVPLSQEILKQAAIFHSRGSAVPDGYVIDRSLLSYTFMLSREFDRSLAELTPADRWLDIGAGRGQAILDYYSERYDAMHASGKTARGKKAQAVAISIEDRRTPQWQQTAGTLDVGQIRYLSGRRLREYAPGELGRFRLITDMMGGFSYTEHVSLFLERVLGLLELNGSFYTLLQDVHAEHGQNAPFYAGSPYLTEIVDANGSEMQVCSWLKQITCVEVSCELRARNQLPTEVYRIRKVCGDVSVPALSLIHYEAGTPPERRFMLDHSALAAPAQTRWPAESATP